MISALQFCIFICVAVVMYYNLASFEYWCVDSLRMAEFRRRNM